MFESEKKTSDDDEIVKQKLVEIFDCRGEKENKLKVPSFEELTKLYPSTFGEEFLLFGVEPPIEKENASPFLQNDSDNLDKKPKWLEQVEITREQYQSASRIIFQAGPGLGDAHIMSGIVLALAKSTLNKNFVLALPTTMEGIFDQSALPQNMKVLFEGKNSEEFLFSKNKFLDSSQLVISINDDTKGDFRNSEILKKKIGFSVGDEVHTAATFTAHAVLDADVDLYKVVDFSRLFNHQLPKEYIDSKFGSLSNQVESPFLADQILYRMIFA